MSTSSVSLVPNQFNTIPSSVLLQRAHELVSKSKELKKEISQEIKINKLVFNSLYSTARLAQGYRVSNDSVDHSIYFTSDLIIPVSYLFKTADLPANFRIQNFNDPRLYDEQFLRSFVQWVNSSIESLNCSQNSEDHLPLTKMPKDPGDFRLLRLYIMLLRDPILFEKTKAHTIGHELCHALEENESVFQWNFPGRMTYVPKIGILGGLSLFGLGLVFAPLISLRVGLSLAGFGAALGTATIALYRFGLSKCREIEKKCDLRAINVLKDANGAFYLFETMRQVLLAERSRDPSLPIDKNGNYLNDLEHPDLCSRVQYCLEWQAKNLQN